MPRELYLVTPLPATLPAIIVAAASIDERLGVRALNNGIAIQLVDRNDTAVLTLESSRQLEAGTDAERVAPGVTLPRGNLWWTDATAPWNVAGTVGIAIVRQLANNLGGSVTVEDGT